jgi:1,2-phenylacetyl-CoA epoxidase PaaB subunit
MVYLIIHTHRYVFHRRRITVKLWSVKTSLDWLAGTSFPSTIQTSGTSPDVP